ncbi:uncharacterized protein I303_106891 [Kwoniella dejecticola CBS 10117]|uniref:C2H2-type domain-containing protein n=1 Tax=Kwoniella dejecticola CBS 10117 TaxID=1296121 RepID=A0A1A5ZTE1_9TREE|nr:uncharacterized protein I303_08470 [Kwoniella dejecticola CBS 10117]OBR81088.1 hypothetical protein I303_08470 [Kwoniella dejecticola CBS 10117]
MSDNIATILPNEAVLVTRGVLQPFQCPTCSKRFTRLENLKRHSALHVSPEDATTFKCEHCTSTFARRDLKRRHMSKKHSEIREKSDSPRPAVSENDQTVNSTSNQDNSNTNNGNGNRYNVLADRERSRGSRSHSLSQPRYPSLPRELSNLFGDPGLSTGSSSTLAPLQDAGPSDRPYFPLSHLQQNQLPLANDDTAYDPPVEMPTPMSTQSLRFDFTSPTMPSLSMHSQPVPQTFVTPAQTSLGLHLFLAHLAMSIPFIHIPTFDASSAPEPLQLGMLALGFQFLEDANQAQMLSSRCYERGKQMLREDEPEYPGATPLITVQSLLLLHFYAVFYACGGQTKWGLQLCGKSVAIARREGLMDPLPSRSAATSDLNSLWAQFIRSETHKRTLFFVYQFDAAYYLILSEPRRLSHLEMKHDMPCSEALWTAPDVSTWAHRSLVASIDQSSPNTAGGVSLAGSGQEGGQRYIHVVRSWMSPTPQIPSVPVSPYSALLVVLFCSTSMREVSGWSTMTGKICFERFEALNASLQAIEPVVCGQPPGGNFAIETEVTWRMTMIELLLWNPSHTNGLVEQSLDAAMAAAITLSTAQAIIFNAQVSDLLSPHLLYFLTFLERTAENPTELPWVTIYAFKAVLVAWQLARAGSPEVIQTVGIGGVDRMGDWVRKVFKKREAWRVGKLVMKSLEELEAI